jgi:hypothetical protein
LHSAKITSELASQLHLVAVEVYHLLRKVPLIHDLLFTGFSQFEVLLFHFVHFVSDSVDVVLDSAHFFVGVFELLFHFFHLCRFLLEGFFVLDELVMDFGAGLTCKDVLKFEEEFLFFADEVFFGFDFLCFGNEASVI